MRTIAEPLAGHLAAGVTTLAEAWIVRRTDGAVFGFTDHDRPLTVAGLACTPVSGFDPSTARRTAGFAAGDEEIAGALAADVITEADLAAGLWDGARVEVHLVNWQAQEQSLLLRTGRIGEVSAMDGAFKAELRGPAAALDQPTGRLYSRFCDAELGDGRCQVPLEFWRSPATVAAGSTARIIHIAGLDTLAAGWFSAGAIAFEAGALAGTSAVIDDHLVDGLGVRVNLCRDLAAAPETGVAVRLTAGCDKRFATCRDRFANHENFRGFPHMPGRDFVFSYALGEDDDGEVLFK